MIPAGFDYLRPATVAEALEMASSEENATFLAGGHALLPKRKLRKAGPSTLIDLGRIAELRRIEILQDRVPPRPDGQRGLGKVVRIGAMITSAEIEYSPEIARYAPLLAEAAVLISDPLIRNRATLGGSLAQADSHGDWPPVVLAAGATVHLRSRDGERAVPARDFFTIGSGGRGSGSTVLRRGELLTAVTVPTIGARTRSTYLKRMHPAAGHAMIGVAVAAAFDTGETCRECRVAVTGTATVATRAAGAEDRLTASRLTPDVIEAAADAANDGIAFTGDAFGSAAYLAELLPVYVNRALSLIASAGKPGMERRRLGMGGTTPGTSPTGPAVAAHSGSAALITGCSSGIGHAAALHLHAAGFDVYATARRLESLPDLAAAGIKTLRLDVTDEESMVAVVGQITAEHGAVAILVNNAGFELAGVVEEVPLSEARREFETNLFGLARLTQLVIPGMRKSGGGRIINISSIFGRFAVPGGAYYAASKHAVTALTDALRLELAAFGVRVVLIEPTAVRTSLNANTVWAGRGDDGPYHDFRRDLADWNARVYAGPPHNIAGRLSVSAEDVAAAITRAAACRRPRARYPVGILARGLFLLRRWLPAAAFDAFIRAQFPVPFPP